MDSIEKTLTATQNLLCALEHNPEREREKDFYEKIHFLRESHKVTTKFLEEKCRSTTSLQNQRFLENATYHSSPGCTHYWSDLKQEKEPEKHKQFSSSVMRRKDHKIPARPRLLPSKMNKSKNKSKAQEENQELKEQPAANKQTVPKPFKFLTRKPLGNTYSRKFIEDMILKKEAEKVEEKKMLESLKPFKASPIPSTTYISNNKFVNDPKYLESIQKLIKQRLSASQQKLKSKSCADLTRITSRPVPLSTYISSGDLNKLHRERDQSKRATSLLKEAHSPPGIKEHSIKTNIAFRLRHKKCVEDEQKLKPPKKVPDFKTLHKQFKNTQARSRPRTTLVIPFNFSETKNSKHRKCRSATPSRRFSANPVPIFSNYDFNTYRTTLSTQLRLEATRNKLSEENSKKPGGFWSFNNDRMKSAKNKLISTVKKSQSTSDISKKAKEKRSNLMSLTHEYNLQLKEMQERVLNRPLIMEMQTSTSHKNALDRKFKNIMNNVKKNKREKPSTSDVSNNTYSVHREGSEVTTAHSEEKEDDEKLSEEPYESTKKSVSSSSSFSSTSSVSSSTTSSKTSSSTSS
ncbi:unnamed protein product [Auanema sp. JU1783]|nr:unnamed protein product [Auanema sp. JU1783]